ncbi:MAG TPA: hypothetical protein PLV59_00680 [Candidatus Dojkabacteria bacterium]|nr:hypothetical protein [Candidatus Dojkabacteria bacterium]
MASMERGIVEVSQESWAFSIGSHIADVAREGRDHNFGVNLGEYKDRFFTFGYKGLGVFRDERNFIFISFGLVLDQEWFVVTADIIYDHQRAPVANALEVCEDICIRMTRVPPHSPRN